MVSITNNTITMTRGDSLSLELSLMNGENVYTPQEGDVITFEVLGFPYDGEDPVLTKTIPNDTLLLELAPADTASLSLGAHYYNTRIIFADGFVDTFINNAHLLLNP